MSAVAIPRSQPRQTVESEVRLYGRTFPALWERATGAELTSEDGRTYLDFFCGAGALNYGHNPAPIRQRLIEHLRAETLVHGLDMDTPVKAHFLERLDEAILAPRDLTYRVQFCGPSGADAVEAAIKLSRKVTGRDTIAAFTGGYHGMTRGALGVTGSRRLRAAGSLGLEQTVFVPFEDGPDGPFDSIAYLERWFTDPSAGPDLPAAVIVEPMQMEGGVYAASPEWLAALAELTARHHVLLICDEIQCGVGRGGAFFCFEQSGIRPDLITMSKSISGFGLPLALVLLRPDLDAWQPGEHTGTFRANQLALLAATCALDYWEDDEFLAGIDLVADRLAEFGAAERRLEPALQVRGQGCTLGIDLTAAGGPSRGAAVQKQAFATGLLVELCGRQDQVVKVMPPLTIRPAQLEAGLAVLARCLRQTAADAV